MPISVFAATDEEATDQDNEKKDHDNNANSNKGTQSQKVDTNA